MLLNLSAQQMFEKAYCRVDHIKLKPLELDVSGG